MPKQPFSAMYIPETAPVLIRSADRAERLVEVGDMFALPTGEAHELRLEGATKGAPQTLQPPFSYREVEKVSAADPGVVFALRAPTSNNPIPDIVPAALHLPAKSVRNENRLDLVFQLIRNNALRPQEDRTQITHRLAEIVAITIMEHVLSRLKNDGLNTARGVGDAHLRKALIAIHEAPEADWTVGSLALRAGVSRSVLAERFRALLDQTPMGYLTAVRMARATRFLRRNDESISEIAYQCGYQSDAAFHKAFKRLIGASPSEYRKSHQADFTERTS